ncbi:MAG: hypothetical protein ACLQVY_05795 [Limisphaerales bacterium]
MDLGFHLVSHTILPRAEPAPAQGGDPPLMGDIGPTTGIVAQQILEISNQIGKMAHPDPATHYSNLPRSLLLVAASDVIVVKRFVADHAHQ